MPSSTEAWILLTDRQKHQAEEWYQTIAPLVDDPGNPLYRPTLTPKARATERGVKAAAVYRLLRFWREGRRDRQGLVIAPPRCPAALAPLLPGPPRGRSKSIIDPAEVEMIEGRILFYAERTGTTRRLTGLVVDELRARERLQGIQAPSWWTVDRIRKAIGDGLLVAAAEGTEGLFKHVLPQLVTALPDAPNITWLLDQWTAHSHVLMPDGTIGRPFHVHVVDAHAGGPVVGCAIGRHLNADLVARALVDAIREKPGADPTLKGKPAMLRFDIGKENVNRQVRDGAAALGIQMNPTTPRLPQAKGLVEVLHRILDEKFSRRLPHYAPSDARVKPSRASPPLPFVEYEQRAREFLFGTYNHQSYTGRARRGSLSRLEIRRSVPFSAVVRKDEELAEAFMPRSEVTVARHGIRVLGVDYFHESLYGMIGQRATVLRDTKDLSRVTVYQEGKLICYAQNALAAAAEMDEEKRRLFLRDRRTRAKALKTEADEKIRAAASVEDWMRLEAQKNLAASAGARGPARVVRQIGAGHRGATSGRNEFKPQDNPRKRWKALRGN